MARARIQAATLAAMIGVPLCVLTLSGANCFNPPPPIMEEPPPPPPPPPPQILNTESRSTTIAITSDDRRIVAANRETNSVTILEVRNEGGGDVANKVAEVPVGEEPRYVAISPNDAEAYVTNGITGNVSIIALTGPRANQVIGEIGVGEEPRGCAITPNGTRLLVVSHTAGTVSIINTANRTVIQTVKVGGNPWAIAITNDGDTDDNDESVFVTQFYGEVIPGGPGEGFDEGKQGVVHSFALAAPDAIKKSTLSPIANAGFNGDRKNFCVLLNPMAGNATFCPDANIADATAAVIAQDPQGAFPNQLGSAIIRGGRMHILSIAAAPEPPLKFNINVQGLVSVLDIASGNEVKELQTNLNNQIKAETQPSEADGVNTLTRVFCNDLVALDATKDGNTILIVSRGANQILRAKPAANGAFDLAASAATPAVRFLTGNLPNGVVISKDGKRAYVNNEVGISVSALNLENNTVITRDIPTSVDPKPGTFEHAVLVGKLAFFTALGTPDNDLMTQPIRSIEPLKSRNKASDNGWSSCASCHPDGLSDRVTWIFDTGPRNTLALDAFFSKDNPADQRISNWNAVRGSVTDFNNNSRGIQGGVGFAGNPPNPNIYNHGLVQGASDSLDLMTLWVQTVRSLNLPAAADSAAASRGRDLFVTNCASCHGGEKWTKSQVLYLDNPAFDKDPAAGGVPRDPGITRAAAQIISYTVGGNTLTFIDNVGTFSAASPIEVRNNGTLALGGIGFNAPSLLGIAYSPPYLHHGAAATLADVFTRHNLTGNTPIANVLNATEQADLTAFLNTIDGDTPSVPSDADRFRDAIGG